MRGPLSRARVRVARRAVGALFLWTGGIHVGIAAADPGTYRHFADGALLDVVGTGWSEVFMAHPRAWALALAAAETTAGALLLSRGRAVAVGWSAVIAFHVLLLPFGLGLWLWALPALVLLTTLAWADQEEWRGPRAPAAPPDAPPA